jgi:hypothetical protein
MAGTIVILEDDEDRTAAMRRLLADHFPEYELRFFDNAPDLIAWVRDATGPVGLFCLDHDLGPNRRRGGRTFDPGTGRDVADFLAAREPACPVLIHSTNTFGAIGMREALREAGWRCRRVVPFGDLEWIEGEWLLRVRKYLRPTASAEAAQEETRQ